MSKLSLKKLDYGCAMGFFAYSSSAAMTPICLLKLMEELSFSLAEGGGIEAVRALLILVVLVVSGFAAARWGKPMVLAWGSLLIAAGMFTYAVAPAYGVVLSAMALVGIGSGIVEGLVNPLVQDCHPNDSGRYLNIVNGFWSIGVFATVLVAGELLTRGVSWRTLIACSGALGVISGILFLLFRAGTGKEPSQKASQTNAEALAHLWKILRVKRFWVFAAALLTGGAAEGAFTFWSASYVQIYFETVPRAGGFGTACIAGGMVAGRMLSGRYVHQKGLRALVLASASIGIGISLLVFAVESLGGFYVVLFLAGLSVACFWPSIQSYAADCLADVDSTMLFILLSCAGIPGFGFSSWLMGIIGNQVGIRAGFAVIPVLFFALFLIIVIDHRVHRRAEVSCEGSVND